MKQAQVRLRLVFIYCLFKCCQSCIIAHALISSNFSSIFNKYLKKVSFFSVNFPVQFVLESQFFPVFYLSMVLFHRSCNYHRFKFVKSLTDRPTFSLNISQPIGCHLRMRCMLSHTKTCVNVTSSYLQTFTPIGLYLQTPCLYTLLLLLL